MAPENAMAEQPEIISEKGRIIRLGQSLHEPNCNFTKYHLTVLTDKDALRSFTISGNFTMTAFSFVGDTIVYNFHYKTDGHIEVKGYGLDWPGGKTLMSQGDVPNDLVTNKVRGIVLRKGESVQGGTRSKVHLAVELFNEEGSPGGKILTFQCDSGFVYPSQCDEGDVVELSYSWLNGHAQLKTFLITEESLRASAYRPR